MHFAPPGERALAGRNPGVDRWTSGTCVSDEKSSISHDKLGVFGRPVTSGPLCGDALGGVGSSEPAWVSVSPSFPRDKASGFRARLALGRVGNRDEL